MQESCGWIDGQTVCHKAYRCKFSLCITRWDVDYSALNLAGYYVPDESGHRNMVAGDDHLCSEPLFKKIPDEVKKVYFAFQPSGLCDDISSHRPTASSSLPEITHLINRSP